MRRRPPIAIAAVLAAAVFGAVPPLPAAEPEKPAPPPSPAAGPAAGEQPAGAEKAAPAGEADALYLSAQEIYRKGEAAYDGRGPAPDTDPAPLLSEAARSFEDFARRFPGDPRAPEATLRLGTTYLLLDEMEKALAAYQRVVDSYPGFKDRALAVIRVGVCQAGLDEPAKAKATFEKFLREFPDRRSEVEKVSKFIREMMIVGRKAAPLSPAGWLQGMVPPEGLKVLEGQPIVLVFFATWCPNTRKELPHLRSLMKKWAGSDVVFIGIADPDDPQNRVPVETYVQSNKIEFFDLALDKTMSSWGPYRVTATPSAALIDRKGIVRWRGHLAFFPNALLKKVAGEK